MSFASATGMLLEEITDFLASIPTAEQILAFKASDMLNQRLHELLDRAGEGELTEQERQELNEYLQISHLLKMLKGKIRLRISGQA